VHYRGCGLCERGECDGSSCDDENVFLLVRLLIEEIWRHHMLSASSIFTFIPGSNLSPPCLLRRDSVLWSLCTIKPEYTATESHVKGDGCDNSNDPCTYGNAGYPLRQEA
jgi:hypothetical protein